MYQGTITQLIENNSKQITLLCQIDKQTGTEIIMSTY